MWGIVLNLKVVFTNQFHQYLREDERLVNPAELPDQPRGDTELNSLELPDQPPRGTEQASTSLGKQPPKKSEFLSHVKITRGGWLLRGGLLRVYDHW